MVPASSLGYINILLHTHSISSTGAVIGPPGRIWAASVVDNHDWGTVFSPDVAGLCGPGRVRLRSCCYADLDVLGGVGHLHVLGRRAHPPPLGLRRRRTAELPEDADVTAEEGEHGDGAHGEYGY